MMTDPTYRIIRAAAAVVALGAAVVFVGTYLRPLRQLRRYRGLLRLALVAAAGVALGALLLVTSPLDYRASAPTPTGLKLYVLSTSNDLFTLRASDGAQTFVRHLAGPPLQMRYHEGSLLILAGPGQYVPVAGVSTVMSSGVPNYTLQAVRGDDGHAVLPALGTLSHVTADLLDHGTLYLTAIADLAHPDAETLSAFSLQAGAIRWQQALSTPVPTALPPQVCGIDGGVLYVLLGMSVAAVRTDDGAVLWRSAPLWQSSPQTDGQTYAQTCVAQDGAVYLVVGGTSGDDPRTLIKLSERDGTQRWHVPVTSLASVAGDRLYVTRPPTGLQLPPRLVVLRASDGAQRGAPLQISISPLQAQYTASNAGVLYVVGHSTTGQPALGGCEIFAIRLHDGARLWHRPPNFCGFPLELRVASGMVYYATFEGDLTALRAADGEVLWTHTGHHGAQDLYWSNTYTVSALGPGVLFVDAGCQTPCQGTICLVWCPPDTGQYLEALNPTTGVLYWRYRSGQIAGYLLSAGA